MDKSYRRFVCSCGRWRKITKRKYTVKCSACGKITKVPAMYEGLKATRSTIGIFR